MTPRIVLRPIQQWPRALLSDFERLPSPFSATWSATKALLLDEVEKLGADEVVVQLAIDEADLRNDGQLRARTKARHPGVVVSVDSTSGPLSFPCDRFVARYYGREDWHENVRAVALGMRSLRQLDRYGITAHGEQYVGWKALGAGTPGGTTREQAAAVLIEWAYSDAETRPAKRMTVGDVLDDDEARATAYRLAARATHPDRGGNADDFRAVQAALEALSSTS